MIALLADDDFNGRIIRGLLRKQPDLDLLTVNQAGLSGQPDLVVIEWAALHGRVLLTDDVNTMLEAVLALMRSGHNMPGVIGVPQHLGIGAVLSELLLIAN